MYNTLYTSTHTHLIHAADSIQEFLAYYRREFPTATTTVKLHLLEDHMTSFLEKWNAVGFGLMAEQGAESVHRDINSIKERYSNMPDPVERLRCTLQEHHLRSSPELRDVQTSS